MGEFAPEPQSVPEAEYTIWVPNRDGEGNELPWLLNWVRGLMNQSGLSGRTVIKDAASDWGKTTEDRHLIVTIAPDTPKVHSTVRAIALGIKEVAKQEGVFYTKRPIESYIVTGKANFHKRTTL